MSPADLGDRSSYLGATDIAAIVGVNPWASPIDVYLEKTEGVVTPGSDRADYGLLLEDAICAMYERETDRRLFRRAEVVHPDYSFIRFHPDRLVRSLDGIFDAKATWQRGGGKYGEPGTDQVPPLVRVQMVCYLGATKRGWADVGLLRRPPIGIYTVKADPELYEWLIAEAVRFWHDHVLKRVPPPPDASESYRRFLVEQHPVSEEIEVVATPEQQLIVDELRAATAVHKAAEKHVDALKNRLIDAMGRAAVLLAPGARITYRNAKPSPRWKHIAELIAGENDVDLELERERDVAGRVGSRKFLATFEGDEEMEEEKAA